MSILRALSPVGRGVLVATLAVSVLSVAMEWLLHVEGTPVFLVSALGILGLAYVVGAATERLGALAGPQVGGILNATFGNVAELIIAFFALVAGELEVVKASLTGSIVGNLLLVLGFSLFLGGLRNGQQRFSPKVAGLDATLLVLAVIGLFVPAVFALSTGGSAGAEPRTLENVSVALVLLVLYALNLVYRLRHPEEVLGGGDPAGHAGPAWSARVAVLVLLAAAALLAVLSEQLVGAIDPFIASFDLTPFFVGVILIPTIGNLAEHLVAVQLAIRDRVDFAMAVAIGSSLQVALFVAPVLVLLGLVVGQPMDLVFTPLEIAAVAAAAGITALIAFDGESNWLEGALLLGVYAILAVSFFYLEG
ncbi:MAG: calcium/proton exchanger, Ca2+:H+ antiporter [Chloroflexi bacterium CSP1-4]|nr:MAG: calcium/proton exchanger, Ca2+:H+ antiporter [Chloroflexi bacterium CSP1-4]